MRRTFTFFGLMILSALLFGCIHSTLFEKPESNRTSGTSTYIDDPDGDSDAKGYTYFPLAGPMNKHGTFIFDPNYNAWAMYDETGRRVNVGRASGGRLYCPDVGRVCKTVVGVFHVVSRGDADCISSVYPVETNGGAPMPYCMHFGDKGYAIHGSNEVPDYNASHGCIRVTPLAARWLNENYVDIGTTVVVRPYDRSNWDDSDESN
jgi:lipoprotein-anchoring transpeptidase ErfK/SrfK